jgi:hypothetical protein
MIRVRRLPPLATAVVAVLATLALADAPRGPTPISPGLHFPSDPSAGAERSNASSARAVTRSAAVRSG